MFNNRFFNIMKMDDPTKTVCQIKLKLMVLELNQLAQGPKSSNHYQSDFSKVTTAILPDVASNTAAAKQQQNTQNDGHRRIIQKSQGPVIFKEGNLLDNKFHVEKMLGKGNFGITYLAKSQVDDQRYAIKLIMCTEDADLATVKSEAKILFKLLHDNIVRYFSAFIHVDHYNRKYFGMVMEYCENCDIQSHIHHYKQQSARISDRRITRWTLEIAEVRCFNSSWIMISQICFLSEIFFMVGISLHALERPSTP